ncbi:MAG: serine dehydratase subunit alpha family protein [Erysipelotrichaceae bacterium]|nr:serine dehydratase subunit alpha family protein [Erysipelotrichaceae bacterium]
MISSRIESVYAEILKNELVEATGCTEPIALALAGAKAREVLGFMPDKVDVYCSGNIIKNVKGVVVPNSGGIKGIDTAVILGMVGGKADKGLQVISAVNEEERALLKEELRRVDFHCHLAQDVPTLYIRIEASKDEDSVLVEIQQTHSNFTKIIRNKQTFLNKECEDGQDCGPDKSLMNVKDIYEYALYSDLSEVEPIIERQIKDNTAISEQGLCGNWGEEVGRNIREYEHSEDIRLRARAAAAAGSDARMNGCPMPVVINSGSGNQGMTVSLPVIEYARELNVSHEKLIRALVLANLIALHQKKYIGYLSAYCGAVSAAAGAGCGVCYLMGGNYEQICEVITNTIASIGGMVCDGAKSSCAGKISLAVEAALLGVKMAMNDKCYRYGEGMIKKDIEGTIKAYGRMAAEGMKATDVEILNIMLED